MHILIESDRMSSGDNYSVVRYAEDGDFKSIANGYRYEFVAQIKVIGDLGNNMKKAQVTLSRLGVQKDDIIIGYKDVTRRVPFLKLNQEVEMVLEW